MNINNLVSSLGLKGNAAGDVSFLVLFLLVSFAISFVLGRHRLLTSFLGIYTSFTIVTLAAFDFLKDAQNKVLFFIALAVAFVVLFQKVIRGSISGYGTVLLVKLFIGGILVVGLVLSVVLSWLPSKELADFITPSAKKFFEGDLSRFLWALGPLVYLAVVRKRLG